MKIAFVSTMFSGPWGGSEELWKAAAHVALKRGHEVATFTAAHPEVPKPIAELRGAGAQTFFRRFRDQRLTSRVIEKVSSSFHALLRFSPDVVCVSQGATYDIMEQQQLWRLMGSLIADNTPYVILCECEFPHAAVSPWIKEQADRIFGSAYRVGFLGTTLLEMSETHIGRRLPNGYVFRNPVNLTDQSVVPWPNGAMGATDEARFASVARLDLLHKAHHIMLMALAREEWSGRSWRLTFAGEGPGREHLEKLVEMYGLESRVHFAGHVSDVRAVWQDHHVLLLSSRMEGVPLSMVEAMLSGRVAVATDVGAVSEWIADGVNGFLAEASTVRSFSKALERAWGARDRWQEIGQRARDTACATIGGDPSESLVRVLEEAAASGR